MSRSPDQLARASVTGRGSCPECGAGVLHREGCVRGELLLIADGLEANACADVTAPFVARLRDLAAAVPPPEKP